MDIPPNLDGNIGPQSSSLSTGAAAQLVTQHPRRILTARDIQLHSKFGSSITARQAQVGALLMEGLSTKDIARKLGLAVGTVKVHLAGLYRLAGVDSRARFIAQFVNHSKPQDVISSPEDLVSSLTRALDEARETARTAITRVSELEKSVLSALGLNITDTRATMTAAMNEVFITPSEPEGTPPESARHASALDDIYAGLERATRNGPKVLRKRPTKDGKLDRT